MSQPAQPQQLVKTSSVQGVALRVTRLNSDGSAVTGADSAYTMNRYVSATFTPVYDGSNTIQQQLANGNFAVTFQISDVFQRIEITAQIAGPDPEFNEICCGGTILTDDDDVVVGWAPTATGEIDQPNGVAMEVWSMAISGGRRAVDRPYYHWMFPRLFVHPSDDSTVENDVMAWKVTGWGNDNPTFAGSGVPGWKWATDRPYQYARVVEAGVPIGVNAFEAVGA
jgi:hypothetical protein